MKRVIYRITDYSDLRYIDYKSCIEAYDDEEGDKIGYKDDFYTHKSEIIKALIEKNKKTLCAFGSGRDVKVSQNKPVVKDNTYNKDLFKLSDDNKKTISGIKGLCGIIRGTIRYPEDNGEEIDVTLEIRSRFDEPQKPWFLYTMIAESVEDTDAGEHTGNAAFDEINEVDIMSMLTVLMFSMRLKKAYESGIYRTYVRREYNDDRLRGSIDIARHIRQNINSGSINVAYSTRERNENNMLNRLIAHAWNALKRDYSNAVSFVTDNDPEFQKAIGEVTAITRDSLKDVRSCVASNRQPITSPFYSDYEDLRELCLQILAEEAGSEYYTEGGENKCMSILFYIPDLWEIYLEKHLRKELPEGIKLKSQDERKMENIRPVFKPGPLNLELYSMMNDEYDKYIKQKRIRPDFVFYKDGKPFFILDAKFKIFNSIAYFENNGIQIYPGWEKSPGLTSEDKFGVSKDTIKLDRDMRVFKVSYGAVVFPYSVEQDCEKNNEIIKQIKSSDYPNPKQRSSVINFIEGVSYINANNKLWSFPVLIPGSIRNDKEEYTYSEWKEDMTKTIDHSIETIINELQRLSDDTLA